MPQITAIDPKKVDDFWGAIKHLIEQAADTSNHYTADDIHKAMKQETAYLWLVHTGTHIDAVVVTRLEMTKRGKEGVVWACAGKDYQKWIHLIGSIEAWARKEGCKFMRHDLRPGWVRPMRKFGYRMTHATIQKEL